MSKLYLILKERPGGYLFHGLYKNKAMFADLPFNCKIVELDSDLIEEEKSSSMEQIRAEDQPTA